MASPTNRLALLVVALFLGSIFVLALIVQFPELFRPQHPPLVYPREEDFVKRPVEELIETFSEEAKRPRRLDTTRSASGGNAVPASLLAKAKAADLFPAAARIGKAESESRRASPSALTARRAVAAVQTKHAQSNILSTVNGKDNDNVNDSSNDSDNDHSGSNNSDSNTNIGDGSITASESNNDRYIHVESHEINNNRNDFDTSSSDNNNNNNNNNDYDNSNDNSNDILNGNENSNNDSDHSKTKDEMIHGNVRVGDLILSYTLNPALSMRENAEIFCAEHWEHSLHTALRERNYDDWTPETCGMFLAYEAERSFVARATPVTATTTVMTEEGMSSFSTPQVNEERISPHDIATQSEEHQEQAQHEQAQHPQEQAQELEQQRQQQPPAQRGTILLGRVRIAYTLPSTERERAEAATMYCATHWESSLRSLSAEEGLFDWTAENCGIFLAFEAQRSFEPQDISQVESTAQSAEKHGGDNSHLSQTPQEVHTTQEQHIPSPPTQNLVRGIVRVGDLILSYTLNPALSMRENAEIFCAEHWEHSLHSALRERNYDDWTPETCGMFLAYEAERSFIPDN